jgi:hypothetical protein
MKRTLAAVMIASALTSGAMSYWSFDRGYAAGFNTPRCFEERAR